MKLSLYQIDTFTPRIFEGNSAAVCPLKTWLSDVLMQQIAAENNLSETAFFVQSDDQFEIRWFTPTVEVDLCGHATLAAAYILFEELAYAKDHIVFHSKSGELSVSRDKGRFVLNFPQQVAKPCAIPKPIQQAFTGKIKACLKSEDYLVVLKDEEAVLAAKPDMNLLKQLDLRGVMITAQSDDYDFVSRFFAPNFGIDEDPVTGSSFTQLAPYWAEVLGKPTLHAKQVSKRGGEVWCEIIGERVKIIGHAVKYLEGTLEINVNSNV